MLTRVVLQQARNLAGLRVSRWRLYSSASNPTSEAAGVGKTTSGSSTEQTEHSTSVDENEMKKFRQLADYWWVENGEFEALHRMNALRVPLIKDTMLNYRHGLPKKELEQINSFLDEKNQQRPYTEQQLEREPLLGLHILDIGCGGGILSEPLARLGAQVTAIDSLKENIICAQMRTQLEMERSKGRAAAYLDRLRYINCTIEDLASVEENNNYFDGVVMSEVVEHVANLNDFMANSIKLLKDKGFLFATTINRTPQSYALAIVAAEYLLGLVPRGTHEWNKFVQPNELTSILEKSNQLRFRLTSSAY